MNAAVKIVLVDDHTIVRNGLKVLIEMIGNFKITAEFSNGLEFTKAYPFPENPDLIILDLTMPVMNGVETVQWLRDKQINIPILILTMEYNEDLILQLNELDVGGYISKNSTATVMKKAIDDILEFGFYNSELLREAIKSMRNRKESPVEKMKREITPREFEFLRLLCGPGDYTYKAIAEIMKVSLSTVDGYRESLFFKLGVTSKTNLFKFATENKIV